MQSGVVKKAYNSYYYVQSDRETVECKLRGRFKKGRFSLTVGDRVEYEPLGGGKGVIERILPRRSFLSRPAVANVDQVVVTFAAARPDFNAALLDRFLVLAEWDDLPAFICMNKADLAEEEAIRKVLEGYAEIGYPYLLVSADKRRGMEALRARLADRVSVLAGPSGVGKSTLLNAIEPSLSLATGALSDKIQRGKHTTRAASLLPLTGGGFVVDTPGFSFTEFAGMEARVLPHCFPEFTRVSGRCRFDTCLHSHEPDCVIKQAVAEGQVSAERYRSYLQILGEIQAAQKEF